MSPQSAAAFYNHSSGDHHVFHTEALDVWVAWDGGTVIIMQGVGGQGRPDDDDDGASASPQTPDGVVFPYETSVSVPAVTADGIDASRPTLSASQPPTQSPTSPPSINPSTGLSTVMSESQAPSSLTSLSTSYTTTETVALALSSSADPTPSPSPPVSTSSAPQTTSSSASVSAEPSTTIFAPPSPTSSEYLSHSPPFYVAIVLGSIAGVAILAALVAWAVRKRMHEKQRRLVDSAVKLPWVHSTGGNHDSGFPVPPPRGPDIESGMRSTNTEVGIINLGSREDMAHIQAWEPSGDRDVGEPRRAENYVDRKPRPPFITQEIPSHMLFSGYVNNELASDTSVLPCKAGRVSLGTIDTHLPMETLGGGSALLITNQLPGDISACSSQEAAMPCLSIDDRTPLHPELGTPRELVPMPRFLGLDGEGLSVPWEEKPSKVVDGHGEAKPRSRIMSAGHIRSTWERQASRPAVADGLNAEGKKEPAERGGEEGGWAMSLRSNFASALNAVAATFPVSINKEDDDKEVYDKLALMLPRRRSSSSRNLLRDASFVSLDDDDTRKVSLSRGSSIKSAASDLWSLVETGNSKGVVHTQTPTSDMCSVSSQEISVPGYGFPRSYALHDHGPLRVKKKMSMALSKHRSFTSSTKGLGSRSRVSTSQSSSAGGGGGGFSSPKRHRSTIGSSMKRKLTFEKRSLLSSGGTSLLTSTPSNATTTTTTASVVTGLGSLSEKRALAREALKMRRRKAKQI